MHVAESAVPACVLQERNAAAKGKLAAKVSKQPMFCFESAVKLFFFSSFVYADYNAVRTACHAAAACHAMLRCIPYFATVASEMGSSHLSTSAQLSAPRPCYLQRYVHSNCYWGHLVQAQAAWCCSCLLDASQLP
jgi:hypothetical protein